MKLMRLVLTGSLLLILAACGNDSPIPTPTPTPTPIPTPGLPGGLPTTPGTPADVGISGTVTAPVGGTVSNTIVIACAESDSECASALSTPVDPTGTYSFVELATEPYIVIAFNDVDTSNSITNGDYLGFYTTDGTNLALVTPPASSIDIVMQVYSDSVPTDPVDPTPAEGGSITGVISYPTPAGGTPTISVLVFACYLTGDEAIPCDENLSSGVETQMQPLTSSFAYSIDSLQAGQYLIFALDDSDLNGEYGDTGDRIGFYPSLDAPAPVSPPATGIDFTLETYISDLGNAEVPWINETAKVIIKNNRVEQRLERVLKTLR